LGFRKVEPQYRAMMRKNLARVISHPGSPWGLLGLACGIR